MEEHEVVYFNNCINRDHVDLYGKGAFYDLRMDSNQERLAVDLPVGQQCVVSKYAEDGRVEFNWYTFTHELQKKDENGDPERVLYGKHTSTEELSKSKAAKSKQYGPFFNRNGHFKRQMVICASVSKPYSPKETGTRNPSWAREELILALELYLRHSPSSISKTHKEVIALSDLLNKLPIHSLRPNEAKFRNPNGVYMKLCNFLVHDPSYTGKGLKAGNRLEKEVWDEYADKPKLLQHTIDLIKTSADPNVCKEMESISVDPDEGVEEGKIIMKLHKMRERNASQIKKKKANTLKKTGSLACEVCSFDFEDQYGQRGKGYAECHHTKPVSEMKAGEKTKLTDLAIVCANCHRMLHRKKAMISVAELKSDLQC